MNALGAAMVLGLGVLLVRKRSSRPSPAPRDTPAAIVEIVRRQAARAGVPLQVALAFARVESNLHATAEGDLDWATKRPDKYRELVLGALHDNPFAHDAARWHSYGLYQLNAAHFTRGKEDPRALLDPELNASRALPYLHGLLNQAGGDPYDARYRYVGCGPKGVHCADSVRRNIRERLAAALTEFQGVV